MAIGFLKRIFGDANQRAISHLQKTVQLINKLEPQFQTLSTEHLKAKTYEFRQRMEDGETLDDLLVEAFALVREMSRRTTGLRHYDVQLIGGMILHQGQVVEMRTGEGKTLVATLPLYLNALTGKGVHLITPNDYLAKYGVQWMGPIYTTLGLSVSVIQSGGGRPDEASFRYDPEYTSEDDRYQYLRPITRREAYACDVTYGTNNEFGFDYLRDNMVIDLADCTQRLQNFAIVDEVDSILIDEARTPLIISGPAEESSDLYRRFAEIVPRLQRDVDYEVEERTQIAILTEAGIAKIEQFVNIPEDKSIYDPEYAAMLPYLDNALRAKEFYHLDKQYVVKEGEIIIVDEFTGRMMFGRRYSEGLHQAIEAKERVTVRHESLTYATITFQNFFRMYDKLAGMTGTAATEKEELHKIYGLDVTVLPTNVEYRAQFGNLTEKTVKPEDTNIMFAGVLNEEFNYKVTVYDDDNSERFYRRLDLPDQIYKSEAAKFKAVIQEIQATCQAGRPILVGTTAIETSEKLSRMLKAKRIDHNVLNAKYHEREAVIIAQAGRPGAVTIATNMAGRGVDILLGGNFEGLARDQMRREEIDLTQISSTAWEDAIKIGQRGDDPTQKYPERWAEILRDRIQECQADRQQVYNLGGLHVIGTERHEARRIDNQLRGRAGRQGDPGSSRFYISLEDELMRRFGGERLKPWMERAGLDEAPLEFSALSKAIASIQERVEGYNFDIRKHVLEYDDVVNKQRAVVYAERRKILSRPDLQEDLMEIVETEINRLVTAHTQRDDEDWDLDGMLAELRRFIPIPSAYSVTELKTLEPDDMVGQFMNWAEQRYANLNQRLGEEVYSILRKEEISLQTMAESPDAIYRTIAQRVEETLGEEKLSEWYDQPLRRIPDVQEAQVKAIIIDVNRLFRDRRLMLQQLDNHWIHHLTALDMLREGIGLRAYGQQNPLVAYQKEAFDMYQEMLSSVQQQIVRLLLLEPRRMLNSQPRQRSTLTSRPITFRTGGASPETTSTTKVIRPTSSARKLGRNDPCWCGSNKKYKDCHWKADKAAGITRFASSQSQAKTDNTTQRERQHRGV
ncbi:MAG: preprotein translocase subunit SecA [Anaerolineae bacterium]|nr:preprotein translocase subunit SecA [Anaerolineae bacterium]